MNRHIVFIGGIFLESQILEIESRSIGVVQNAADVLQKAFLKGLSAAFRGELTLINLPFVNSYPRGYRDIYFSARATSSFARFRVIQKGWLNLEFVRLFSRLVVAFRGLHMALGGRTGVIVLYSAHLPFMLAAILYSKIFRGSKICLILPDFPEFMGEGGPLYRIVKYIESRIFYFLTKRLDYFVLLTRFMADRLGVDASLFSVVEGMTYVEADQESHALQMPKGPNRIFLYTGTLAARYGILDLLSAFAKVASTNVELWICGDGDSRAAVEEFAKRDQRVTYFGQVSRRRAVKLQQQAHVLVNPRPPTGEYTRYSFPSKTIEYLVAARPIVMHRLPGVPSEYLPYLITPETCDATGLSRALARAAEMSVENLRELGRKGREFALREKSPERQCMKILRMLEMV